METIEEIDKAIADLKERRKKLVRALEKQRRNVLDDYMLELFGIIGKNPGINREDIWKQMQLNDSTTYNNTITSLRRRNLITNKGTRQRPIYYIKD